MLFKQLILNLNLFNSIIPHINLLYHIIVFNFLLKYQTIFILYSLFELVDGFIEEFYLLVLFY